MVFAFASLVLLATTSFAKQEATKIPEKTRATFGILQFDADSQMNGESWWSQRVEIMNGIAEMMTTAMVEKGYRLIERKQLSDILKEQDLGASGRLDPATAAKVGKVIGCDYLILGAVTQWGISKKGGSVGGMLGRVTGVGASQTKAEATIDIRIVNTTTGEIMCVGKGKGSESNTSVSLTVDWWKSIDFSGSEWYTSMVGKATRKAVDDCIKKVDPKASKLPTLGLTPTVAKMKCGVIAVLSATEAIIELDPRNPLKVGDVLTLKRITNQVKKDGKVIFEDSKVVGKVEVIEVQESGAKVRLTTTGEEIKEGDIVVK
jgi:curli biogenesis system outer membrane secretion channel CsgG